MFSDLARARSSLKERLAPHVPDSWEINEFVRQLPTEFRNPVIVFEFHRFERSANGVPLAPGFVAATFDIIIASSQTVEREGEDDIDSLALALVRVLDKESDIYWDSADKQKADTGSWLWRIHTTVLTETKE